MHQHDPTQGKPLISSLSEINPVRPKNWLLYGVAGVELPAQTLHERAWRLAGRLYSWGEDLSLSDQPFPDGEIKNAEIVQAIFQDPQLAGAEQMIGRYLLRQLVLLQEKSLLLDVLPPGSRKISLISSWPIVVQEAFLRARQRDLDHISRWLPGFRSYSKRAYWPLLFAGLASLRLQPQSYATASTSLQGKGSCSKPALPTHLFSACPTTPTSSGACANNWNRCSKPTIRQIQKSDIVNFSPASWSGIRLWLDSPTYGSGTLVKANCSGRAYRLLAAVQSRNPRYIEEALSAVDSSEAAELFRSMPTNLLKAGIGALADYPDPSH